MTPRTTTIPKTTMRVEIPGYCYQYRRGDRTGVVTKISKSHNRKMTSEGPMRIDIAHVLLDQSQTTVMVELRDCTEIVDQDPYGMHEERRRHP